MELCNQPTDIRVLKTITDKKGTTYELRGQENLYSPEYCFKTNYYELHKKEKGSDKFEKCNVKEEIYMDTYEGYKPSSIQREIIRDGKVVEKSDVFKWCDGVDFKCEGEALSMNGTLRAQNAKEAGKKLIKLPENISINSNKLSPMGKRIMKLFQHV